MGELYRQAKGLDKPQAPTEMVTIVATMPKAAWAGLKMMAELAAGSSPVSNRIARSLEAASVLEGHKADILVNAAGILKGYDPEEVAEGLRHFISEAEKAGGETGGQSNG